MEVKPFVERLKLLREKKKMSQRKLAELLNVSAGTVGAWETGRNEPSQETLIQIANIFGVSVDYLIGHTNNPTPYGTAFNIQDFLPEDVKEKLSALENSPTPEYLEKVGEFLINLARTLRRSYDE